MFGTTNNPWDTTRTPGGSSGGAAAALAAGLCALELGSDIGGSIRTPCHWNGLFGHKATHGIIPIRGHIPGPPGMLSEMDLGVAGPMARSAEDLDLALGVLAGPTRRASRGLAVRAAQAAPHGPALATAWRRGSTTATTRSIHRSVTGCARRSPRCAAQESASTRTARPFEDALGAFHLYERLLWGAMIAGFPDELFQGFLAHAQANPDDQSSFGRTARAGVQYHRDWAYATEARAQHRRASRRSSATSTCCSCR